MASSTSEVEAAEEGEQLVDKLNLDCGSVPKNAVPAFVVDCGRHAATRVTDGIWGYRHRFACWLSRFRCSRCRTTSADSTSAPPTLTGGHRNSLLFPKLFAALGGEFQPLGAIRALLL